MGTVRQRRKQKSSLPKVRPKSKPKVTNPKSNPLIAKNWDEKLTLSQNYRKLGLTSKLNARTGGIEKTGKQIAGADNLVSQHHDPLAIVSAPSKTKFDPEEIQVERDPRTGAILRITDPSWEQSNPLNDPLNDLEDDKRVPGHGTGETTEFVRGLEEQAAIEAPKKGRQQSQKEQQWIEELVAKHGDNYAKMMRDRKMNVYQLSEGDIKKRVKKWRATSAKEAQSVS